MLCSTVVRSAAASSAMLAIVASITDWIAAPAKRASPVAAQGSGIDTDGSGKARVPKALAAVP